MIKDRFPNITQYLSIIIHYFSSPSQAKKQRKSLRVRVAPKNESWKNLRSSHESCTLRNTRELRGANAYFERGHVVSSPCNIRGGGIGANNGTPAPATKQHSAGTTSSALSTGPQFVSVLLHNTRCGAVTRMRDEVLRCLITPPSPVQTAFRGVGVGGGRESIGEQRFSTLVEYG